MNIKGQIYVATCKETYKQYVGQTRTHYKNHDKYTEAGYLHRWKAHVREAYSEYKHECAKLNRAIRKYGENCFDLELVHECDISELDRYEIAFIDVLDTYKLGYNLTPGGKCGQQHEGIKRTISQKLKDYNDEVKLEKLDGVKVKNIKLSRISSCGVDIASLTIRPLEGDYIKLDFGGVLCSFDDSIKRAVKFALLLTDESNIIIQEQLYDHVNLPKAQRDDKLMQNSVAQMRDDEKRYEKLKQLVINRIRIERNKNPEKGQIRMAISTDNGKKMMYCGGSLTSFDQSLQRAINLALRLVDKEKIEFQQSIDIKL